MDAKYIESSYQQKNKTLTHLLLFSGLLNIACLIMCIVYSINRHFFPSNACETLLDAPVLSVPMNSYHDVLSSYFDLSYNELVKILADETHVQDGQRRCDLALAILGARHDVDLEKVCLGECFETVSYQYKDEDIVLLIGANSLQQQSIGQFFTEERWPFTPYGLFKRLQSVKKEDSNSLYRAISLTDPFLNIKRILQRLSYYLTDKDIIELITCSEWGVFESLSKDNLALFLSHCMQQGSPLAAYLLVLEYKDYALHQLSNEALQQLIGLLTEVNDVMTPFLNECNHSIRPASIKQAIKDLTHKETRASKELESEPLVYTVKEGDSLWKISQRFGVSVQTIQEQNRLESLVLQPGEKLTLNP